MLEIVKNGRKSVHGKIQKWSQKCTWGGRKSVHIVIDNTVIDKGKPQVNDKFRKIRGVKKER